MIIKAYTCGCKDWVVKNFIKNGAPREKIILGLATYGKSFVWNSDARMIGGPAKYGESVTYKQVQFET